MHEKKRLWPNLMHCPIICLERLRKTTKNVSQDNQAPVRDLYPGPPEYEEGKLATRLRWLVHERPLQYPLSVFMDFVWFSE
jgi:hypothetical protein